MPKKPYFNPVFTVNFMLNAKYNVRLIRENSIFMRKVGRTNEG